MESNWNYYSFRDSLNRLDEILDGNDNEYVERDNIPPRNSLTFKNGFYVNVSAIFVDIRDSSSFPENYYRPTIAKIYRSFISEVVAIMNGDIYCQEINIVGDCVSGIFKTNDKEMKNSLIDTATKINGIINILNHKLQKRGIDEIKVGIGMDYGRALMIKAGYKGRELNEIVWMGNVVNNASKLGKNANNYFNEPILISSNLYDILPIEKKILFEKKRNDENYESNEIHSDMEEWLEENQD